MKVSRHIHTAGRRSGFALVAAVLLLGGCIETDPGHNPQAQINTVKWSEFSHSVAFARTERNISAAAARTLDAFLRQERVKASDRVFVVSQPVIADAKKDRLAARRETSVEKYLARRRLQPERSSAGAFGPAVNSGGPDSILVVVKRPLVVTPYCEDLKRMRRSEEIVADPGAFGCINTAVLGSMVANPNDLVEGRELDSANSDRMTLALRRYRTNKVTQQTTPTTQ